MCGRIIRKTSRLQVSVDLGMEDDFGPDLPPRYNIPPGVPILTVRRVGNRPEFAYLHRGLIPSWAKDQKSSFKMINARAETIAEKPAFREALQKRRCVIPVDGFYEWQKVGEKKIPFLIRLKSERVFFLAGVWEIWLSADGKKVESCAVVTVKANECVAPIHDRMPAILPRQNIDEWLNSSQHDAGLVMGHLVPFPSEEISITRVSQRVNNWRNDDAACLDWA